MDTEYQIARHEQFNFVLESDISLIFVALRKHRVTLMIALKNGRISKMLSL